MVLSDLQGKSHVRQRSISADLIYSLLFVFNGTHYLATLGLGYFSSRKSKGPPTAKSRYTPSQVALYSLEIASFLAMAREAGAPLAKG